MPHEAIDWKKGLLALLPLIAALVIGATAPAHDAASAYPQAPAIETVAFDLGTTDGSHITSAELEGKPTIVWFWAPWCPASQDIADDVAAEAKLAGDTVRFVGIGEDDTLRSMKRFVRTFDLTGIEHGVDLTGDVGDRFGVDSFPTFVVLFPDGYHENVGSVGDRETLHELVEYAAEWASVDAGLSA